MIHEPFQLNPLLAFFREPSMQLFGLLGGQLTLVDDFIEGHAHDHIDAPAEVFHQLVILS